MKILDEGKRQLARLSEERFYLVLLSVAAIVTAAFLTNLGVSLHRNFLTIACDTAAFQNAIVNTLCGSWFRDTAYDGPNILGLHTTFVLLLLAPIYALFPSADTLFTLQIYGVYSAVIPLYLVGVEFLRKPLAAFLIAAAALASPLLLHMAMSPFHPETWIGAAVLWSYYFYLRERAIGFWASLVFAVCCSEQAALIYVVLGAAWLLTDDGLPWRQRYGRWALGAGVGWLFFTLEVLLPLMRHPDQHNLFAYNYSDWGIRSGPGLVVALAHDPVVGLAMLLSPTRWLYVAALVGVPLFLAFFSRRSLILLAAFPVYFLMSDHEFLFPIHAYYFQFAFLAGYLGLIFFLARTDLSTRPAIAVLAVTVFINAWTLCPAFGFYQGYDMWRDEAVNGALHAAFDRIPPEAAVYCPHRFSAYLSNRPNMVMGDLRAENLDFKAMLDAKFSVTDVHPEQIDYIVCDLVTDQCGWRRQNLDPAGSKLRAANIQRLIDSDQWQDFWRQDDVVILQRAGK